MKQDDDDLYPDAKIPQPAVAEPEHQMQRPVISAVPTEPEIINQQQQVKSSPHEPTAVAAPTPVQQSVKTTSIPSTSNSVKKSTVDKSTVENNTKLLLQKIKDLEEDKKALSVKLKKSENPVMMAQPVQNLQGEDPGTLNKVMIILFIIAFILGWMVSSFFCKPC